MIQRIEAEHPGRAVKPQEQQEHSQGKQGFIQAHIVTGDIGVTPRMRKYLVQNRYLWAQRLQFLLYSVPWIVRENLWPKLILNNAQDFVEMFCAVRFQLS